MFEDTWKALCLIEKVIDHHEERGKAIDDKW